MREHKFRVWDKWEKKFIYWGFIEDGFKGIATSNYGMTMEYVKNNSEEYTGLKDKNGVEIWERDIIEYCSIYSIGEIKWDKYEACFVYKSNEETTNCFNTEDMEKIGNIHENPKLLEG